MKIWINNKWNQCGFWILWYVFDIESSDFYAPGLIRPLPICFDNHLVMVWPHYSQSGCRQPSNGRHRGESTVHLSPTFPFLEAIC